MGQFCTALCAGLVFAFGILMVRDKWLDRDARLAGVGAILLGVGALLHAVGVW